MRMAVDSARANPATEQTGDAVLARFIQKLLIALLVLALALAAWRLADLGILLFGAVLAAMELLYVGGALGGAARNVEAPANVR